MQPVWTPDNNLLFIGDQTGWWNLYQYSPDGNHQNLLPCEADVGGCQWVFGRPDFSVEPSDGGTVIMKRKEVIWTLFFYCTKLHLGLGTSSKTYTALSLYGCSVFHACKKKVSPILPVWSNAYEFFLQIILIKLSIKNTENVLFKILICI